jgi:hypothetical protein
MCASCSSVGFFLVSMLGSAGIAASSFMSNYQLPLRLVAIGLLLWALYSTHRRITASCRITQWELPQSTLVSNVIIDPVNLVPAAKDLHGAIGHSSGEGLVLHSLERQPQSAHFICIKLGKVNRSKKLIRRTFAMRGI